MICRKQEALLPPDLLQLLMRPAFDARAALIPASLGAALLRLTSRCSKSTQ